MRKSKKTKPKKEKEEVFCKTVKLTQALIDKLQRERAKVKPSVPTFHGYMIMKLSK